MRELDLGLLAAGLLVLAVGVLSRPMERWPVSKPLIALLLGVVLSPEVTGLLDPAHWGMPEEKLVKEASRLALAIALMAVALRLPGDWLRNAWKPWLVSVAGLMPLMWLVTSLLAWAVLGLHPVVAFLVGAILTPTDPIVASSIVQGPLAKKALPARLRHLLSAESGANDGLAVLFVLAPILLLTHLAGPAEAWALEALVRKAVLSVLFGAALGYVAALVFAWASDHDDMEVASHMGYTLALAILTLAAGELLHLNGVLAVFVAGIAFTLRTDSSRQKEEENVQEAVNLFFTLPAFALLGLVLPWEGWLKLGWKGLLLAGLVLALRRLPAVFLLRRWLGGMRAPRDYLWYGWFGPIGASAAFYAAEAHERTGLTEVWDVATLVIVASLVAHGVTSGPWARAYGRRAGRLAAGDERGASGGDQGKEERSAKGSAQA